MDELELRRSALQFHWRQRAQWSLDEWHLPLAVIEGGEVVQSREMYFAIYQALAEDERRAGLFRNYPPR